MAEERGNKRNARKTDLAPVEENMDLENSPKITTYLITIPSAVLKFKHISTDKKPVSPSKLPEPLLEGPFGLGPLVFPALQRFNNIDCFMFLYFVVTAAHGIVFSLVDLSFKKLDKEFSLSETERFFVDYSDYHASFLVAILVAYYGGRMNRSRWIAASAFILGIASIVFAILFYEYEIIKPVEESEAISDAAQVLGYMAGFAIGLQQTPKRENLNGNENEDQFRKLQKNWWSGFLFVALLSWCTVLPLLCFPSRLPGAYKLSLEKEKEPPSFDKRLKNMYFGSHLKDMFEAVKCLLRNPLLICYSLCKTTESLTFRGSTSFVPLYLENQFLLTPSLANMLTGLIILPGLAIGHFLGGLIIDRLEMNCKNKIRFTVVSSTVALVLFMLILFVECETVKFAGINEDYDGSGILGNLTAPCNEKCACPSSIYASICGRDDTEYFSPCFAGCKASKNLQNEKTYYNCSCIKEGLTTADTEGDFVDAVSGKCSTKCHTLPLFFAFFFSSIIFSNLPSIPVTLTILQSVPAHLNSLSLGITYTIWRFSGSIPAPLVFDLSTSHACIYWNINQCGIKERCWIYNKAKMVYIVMGLCVFFQSSTSFLGVCALYKFDAVVNPSNESLVNPVMKENEKTKENL